MSKGVTSRFAQVGLASVCPPILRPGGCGTADRLRPGHRHTEAPRYGIRRAVFAGLRYGRGSCADHCRASHIVAIWCGWHAARVRAPHFIVLWLMYVRMTVSVSLRKPYKLTGSVKFMRFDPREARFCDGQMTHGGTVAAFRVTFGGKVRNDLSAVGATPSVLGFLCGAGRLWCRHGAGRVIFARDAFFSCQASQARCRPHGRRGSSAHPPLRSAPSRYSSGAPVPVVVRYVRPDMMTESRVNAVCRPA